MKTITISVDGKEYPARETMGAMLEFKRLTGYEADALSQGNISDFAKFIFCCVKSACRKDKIDFPYSLEDFCDSIDADTINSWTASLAEVQSTMPEEETGADGDKKK